MSTTLWIETVSIVDITNNVEGVSSDSIELSEDFLFEFFVNDKILNKNLSNEEIEAIRPNWGTIELKSTDTLGQDDRVVYLELLQDVIKSNSTNKLDEFLHDKGLVSDSLEDRAKSPEAIIGIIHKLVERLGNDDQLVIRFRSEIGRLNDFLIEKIKNKERVLIEFSD